LLEPDPSGRGRKKRLQPGESGWAQIRLAQPTAALAGDRFVIRRFSPVITIGGGTIVDNRPPRREKFERRRERLEALESNDLERIITTLASEARFELELAAVVSRSGANESELREALDAVVASGAAWSISEKPRRIVHRERHATARQALLDRLEQFHAANPLLPGEPTRAVRSGLFKRASEAFFSALIDRLVAAGDLALEGELVRLSSHRIRMRQDEQAAQQKILDAFEQAGLTVPSLKEFLAGLEVDAARAQRILSNLVRAGELVKATNDLVFHKRAIDELLAKLRSHGPSISVGEFKDLAGVSRKYAIPLLEYLDRARVTARQGERRRILL
jgi:selenocysteine-specific elongation factor